MSRTSQIAQTRLVAFGTFDRLFLSLRFGEQSGYLRTLTSGHAILSMSSEHAGCHMDGKPSESGSKKVFRKYLL